MTSATRCVTTTHRQAELGHYPRIRWTAAQHLAIGSVSGLLSAPLRPGGLAIMWCS
jgi:hypothetical protein